MEFNKLPRKQKECSVCVCVCVCVFVCVCVCFQQFNKPTARERAFRCPGGTEVNGIIGTTSYWLVTFDGNLATSRWKLFPTWSTADLLKGGPQRL